MKLKNIILATIMILPCTAPAQEINNTMSFKNINTESYFRINYDNDYFSSTDQYYTQGINFEIVAPWVKRSPLSRTLIAPHFNQVKYGLGLEHNGYTPKSISSDAILYGDRPFAADVSIKSFSIATDSVHNQRLASTLSVGVIGPSALGKEMQTTIHEKTHNIIPHGWDNQIRNDLLLNYQVVYQKQLVAYRNIFSLSADAIARVGTVNDKASLGATLMIGYFDSPFSTDLPKDEAKRRFRMYAYEHPEFSVVAYDATLQGGMFSSKSPYTIASSDIEHITFQNRFGFVVNYQRLYLEYFQGVSSNEFKTSQLRVWGGIQIAFGI